MIRTETDLNECRKLWDLFSPKQDAWDDWDLMYAFHDQDKHQLNFLVHEGGDGNPDGLVPLVRDTTKDRLMLMAGSYLAIGSCMSSITKNQVIAFILSVVLCFVFVLVGLPGMLNFLSFLPDAVLEMLRSFSILDHFQETIIKGVIDARDLIFFGTLIGCFLFMNAVIIELKKAD